MPDSPPPIGFKSEYSPYPPIQEPFHYDPASLSYPMPMPLIPSAPIHESSSSSSSSNSHSEIVDVKSFSNEYQTGKIKCCESGHCWQILTPGEPFPYETAVRAGRDADGTDIYVGRAFHEGDMVPAKILADKNVAYIAYGGEEIAKEVYEVMREGTFVWEFASNGTVPEGAVEVGQTTDGEKLYMARALYGGSQCPGKLQATHGCLYIPFGGAEVVITDYEVLCIK